jgi:hypothetical protein
MHSGSSAVSPKQHRKKGTRDALSLGFSKGCGGYFSQQATKSFSLRMDGVIENPGDTSCKQGEPSMDRLTPVQSIREKFRDCTSNQLREIRECRIKTCALWPYRMGKRPKSGDLVLPTRKGVK